MEDQYSARLRSGGNFSTLLSARPVWSVISVGPKLVTEIIRCAKTWSYQKRQFPKMDNFGVGDNKQGRQGSDTVM